MRDAVRLEGPFECRDGRGWVSFGPELKSLGGQFLIFRTRSFTEDFVGVFWVTLEEKIKGTGSSLSVGLVIAYDASETSGVESFVLDTIL